MKTQRNTLLILFLISLCLNSYGQEVYSVAFESKSLTFSKSAKDDKIEKIKLKVKQALPENLNDYSLRIKVDSIKSTLSASEYALDFKERLLINSKVEEAIYLTILKDTLETNDRKLYLSIDVFDKSKKSVNKMNLADNQKIEIIVKGIKKEEKVLSNYSYLSYAGTNFDLVDGTKPKNLFFATNVFIPPVKNKNRYGFYLSLYGNRTMSDIDSTGNVRRTSKIIKQTDTTYLKYTEQTKMITTRVSDNIGAHINLLVPFFNKNEKSDLKMYYSPSLEFVWRRTKINQQFKDPILQDSTMVGGIIPGSMVFDTNSNRQFNEYSFNAGLAGLFVALENSAISVRIHASTGYSSNFYPTQSMHTNTTVTTRSHDIFFSGRVWITEPVTGITLQAEVTNTSKNPRPFFGATLSKAFNLKDIGIFKPLNTAPK